MRRCRGRPKCPRRVEIIPSVNYFKPRGIPLENLKVIELSVVELEALRLVDLLGLEQDSAATKMGISRRAFWNELTNARMKVTKALVNGCAIKIEGGEYTMVKRKFVCLKCENEWSLPFGGGRPEKCPKCGSKNFHRYTECRGPPRQTPTQATELRRKCMHGHGFGRPRCCAPSEKNKKKIFIDEEE